MVTVDRVVVVDWSANSAPKLGRDSIWIAVCDKMPADGDGVRDSGSVVVVENLATRTAAEAFLVELLEPHRRGATLVGVDFSLGYPSGTAAALGLAGSPWQAMWKLLAMRITDDHRNGNDRFAVAGELNEQLTGRSAPFWGCPPSARSATLGSTKPASTMSSSTLAEWRTVETVLREQGHRPFSSWQLLGAGAVGSQSLLGIARLERLRARLGSRVLVWPFTTGLAMPALDDGAVVVAEVWPALTPEATSTHPVRDARQVIDTARWLAALASSGELEDLMSPNVSDTVSGVVEAEEGWVLGVTG